MNSYGSLQIRNGNIVTHDGQMIEKGALLIREGKITWIGTEQQLQQLDGELGLENDAEHGAKNKSELASETIFDANGGWLLPGFIDVHVHGGFGADFMDATHDAFDTITRFHNQHGTTAMLATTMTATHKDISAVLKAVDEYTHSEMPHAQLLGVHLEGPFISPKYPGAQNPKHIIAPQLSWLEDWTREHPGIIRQLTLAPETTGALSLIAWLKENKIVAACGHTNATYAQIEEAVEQGLRHAVHAFNAMSPLHHREPGTVGAVLTDERISTEVIADGHHVHPAGIRLLAKMKDSGNLLLITDAMCAAGLSEGIYSLGGLEVNVQGGVARLVEGDSLAGSTLTMIDAFRFCVEQVGLTIPQVSQMASGNPAALLGIADQVGSISIGKQADLILVSPDLQISNVWIKGKEIEISA